MQVHHISHWLPKILLLPLELLLSYKIFFFNSRAGSAVLCSPLQSKKILFKVFPLYLEDWVPRGLAKFLKVLS